jgi:catechol 2,3-dioxygenase-like lactoylglutathione lyase family enzyme
MGPQRMEHFLVLTDDIEKTKDFYCDALGMRVGFRPDLGFPGYWIYLGEVPVVHIAEHEPYIAWTREMGIPISTGPYGTGALDHVAFNATDFDATVKHLREQGYELSYNVLEEIGLSQIFLKDPNGLAIELNFRARSESTTRN